MSRRPIPPNLRHEPPAKKRCERIKDILANAEKYGKLHVNCKYRPQLKDQHTLARDLRYMIKQGYFKIGRDGATYYANKNARKRTGRRTTYLIPVRKSSD